MGRYESLLNARLTEQDSAEPSVGTENGVILKERRKNMGAIQYITQCIVVVLATMLGRFLYDLIKKDKE